LLYHVQSPSKRHEVAFKCSAVIIRNQWKNWNLNGRL
jgi:hypothetical protein